MEERFLKMCEEQYALRLKYDEQIRKRKERYAVYKIKYNKEYSKEYNKK